AERKKEQKALERRQRDREEAANPPYARFRVRAFSTAPATLSNDAREAMIPASYGMKEDQTTYWFFNESKDAREYAARGSRVLSQNLHDDLNLKRTETTVAFNARARNEADLQKMGIRRALDPKDFEADSDALVAAAGDKPRFHEVIREMALMPERIPDGLGQLKTMIKRYYPTMPAAEVYNHVMNALYIQFTDDRYINGLAEQTRTSIAGIYRRDRRDEIPMGRQRRAIHADESFPGMGPIRGRPANLPMNSAPLADYYMPPVGLDSDCLFLPTARNPSIGLFPALHIFPTSHCSLSSAYSSLEGTNKKPSIHSWTVINCIKQKESWMQD
ncbi:unnamed protein product, partial [Oikopleura dioica]